MKFTSQRRVIAEVFFEAGHHASLTQLLDLVRRRQSSIGYATVYRTMKLMAESGLASAHKFVERQEARYEPEVQGEHHDHLICTECGAIVEFEDSEIERLQHSIARRHGFEVTSHRHEIYGLCAGCHAG